MLAGLNNNEDASVYRLSEKLALVHTVDFFTPVVDDPFLFGAIAAANALSDVYAMGGKPLLAANILCYPTCSLPPAMVAQILAGGLAKVEEAGAFLSGGHTIEDAEPKYGLSVVGLLDPSHMTGNHGGQSGDYLFLTKPVGSGAVLTALKAEMIAAGDVEICTREMMRLNKRAAEIGQAVRVKGATDITGFGLAGHLHEFLTASNLTAELWVKDLVFYPGAREAARMGLLPAGMYRNRDNFAVHFTGLEECLREIADLIFDPQTSGGLLLAVPPPKVEMARELLREAALPPEPIGRLVHGEPGKIILVN
jgi:selenide,water dikinase